MLTNLHDVIKDAHDNYENGRLKDAYSHYNQIADHYFETLDIHNAIYYVYRSIICLGEGVDLFRDLLKLGTYLVKYGLYATNSLIQSTDDPRKQLKLLSIQDKIVTDLSLQDMQGQLDEARILNLNRIIQEHDISLEDKLEHLVILHSLQPENNDLPLTIYHSYLELSKRFGEDEINIYQKLDCLQKSRKYAPNSELESLEVQIKYLEGIIDN